MYGLYAFADDMTTMDDIVSKNMAWDILTNFQSRGRTMEHQIACFFMSKQASTLQFYLVKK